MVKEVHIWSGKPLSNLQRRWVELNIEQSKIEEYEKEQRNLKLFAQLIYLIVNHPADVGPILFTEEQEHLVSDVFEEELAEISDPFWSEFNNEKGIENA